MIQTNASRLKELGFALLQKHRDSWKLTQAGSRFITDTESRYAMVELEYWVSCGLFASAEFTCKKCKNSTLLLTTSHWNQF